MSKKFFFSGSKIYYSIAFCLLILACGDERKEVTGNEIKPTDTIKIKPVEPPLIINYFWYPYKGLKALTNLKRDFGAEGRDLILALNRLDNRNIKRKDSLVVPDTIFNNIMAYSPFPEKLDAAESIPKLLLLSHRIQAFAAYEYGKLVRWGPTSLGKKSTPTPNGLYHTNWKAKKTISTIDSSWILPWAFNLDNFEGISIHQFDLPGYPASHACARLLEKDAQWIYYWAEQWIVTKDQEHIVAFGTPVLIFGEYDFNGVPPWKKLAEDNNASKISEEEINQLVVDYSLIIKKRREIRDSVIVARETDKTKSSLTQKNNLE
jgi:hypothetical protein